MTTSDAHPRNAVIHTRRRGAGGSIRTENSLAPIPAIREPTVIFVINRFWSPGSDDHATYDATRRYWRVGAQTRERAAIALGVAGGVVRGAYRIESWRPGPDEGRWGFEGVSAPDLGVVGTSVARLAPPRGAANPVRLYLNGIEPEPQRPIDEIARELNAEPLARIMYGQRELFHSNFLAWFFDALPAASDAVFRDLTHHDSSATSKRRRAERERENLDLVLHWPDTAPLVIENKVFSLPQLEQLEDYRAKTAKWKGAAPKHVLLSMSPPNQPVDGWQYVSYQELAERIDLALDETSSPDAYETETVSRYSRIVRLLSALLDITIVRATSEPAWLDASSLNGIGSRQTRTALHKLRAQRVASSLVDHGQGVGWTESAISHSQPLVGWRRIVRVDGHEIEAGWQYQDDQFRLCVVLKHLEGRSARQRQDREDFAEAHPEFFDMGDLVEVLKPVIDEPKPKNRFEHFAPDFVYRYFKVSNPTIDQLIAATATIDARFDAMAD